MHAQDGHPLAAFDEVQAEAVRRHGQGAEHELKQEQAEISSAPSVDLAETGADLRRRRDELRSIAAARGFAVAATATSPVAGITTTTLEDRYERMEVRFGLLERMQLTCGTHVHVSVDSPGEGIAIIDRIRGWLAPLLALSANSPFWLGEDTGYASYRNIVWGQWPTAGPTELFGSYPAYRELVDDLLGSGTILDEGMIYFDARLSRHYPTVEIRVADVCTDLSDTITVTALARALVETAAAEAADGVPAPAVRTEMLRIASWAAARFGLSGELVDPHHRRSMPAADLVDRLIDHVKGPLAEAGDLQRVEDGVSRLLASGTGADLQRAAYARHGSMSGVTLDVVARTGP